VLQVYKVPLVYKDSQAALAPQVLQEPPVNKELQVPQVPQVFKVLKEPLVYKAM
jgi:hypothetical protein